MTQDLESLLRKSLDHTDRLMKVFLAIWALMATAVGAGVLWLDHLSRTADVRAMILFSVVILLLALSVNLILTSVVVVAMTKKTLKAIQLLSGE